ncbi:hypothetical protein [Burkholderia latens]|uniref:hypothetical protein n=1 Tax=Burkholderia latens TaxID=488446 RepID=UPI0015889E94|nr:hypothetical protein [Burkholderia latens]
MECSNRFPRVLRVSPALRRLPGAYAARRLGDVHDVRQRPDGSRDARRTGRACRIAWPAFDADDGAASESGS